MINFLNEHNNDITIFSVNIQSLNSKFNELQGLIKHLEDKSQHFDIICLQESWLSEDDNYDIFNLDGYKLYKKHFEADCSTHGGLVVYARINLNVTKIEYLKNRQTYEGIVVHLKTESNKMFKIINIYRPPRNNFDRFIEDFVPTIYEPTFISMKYSLSKPQRLRFVTTTITNKTSCDNF